VSIEPAAEQPTILAFARDPANLVTLFGLALGTAGLAAAMSGSLRLAVALGIWAMVCDYIDGPVARASRSRTDHHRAYGVQLDSLADIVCSVVLPAAVLLQLDRRAPLAVVVGLLLVLSGAMRLAYFNVFGRVGGSTVGLPVAYTPAVIAVPFLFPHAVTTIAVPVLLLAVAVLQVMPARVPDVRGMPMLLFLGFSLLLSIVLLV
jgi:CDP-diacylglycerol--serine O-phosphatidyltransferase